MLTLEIALISPESRVKDSDAAKQEAADEVEEIIGIIVGAKVGVIAGGVVGAGAVVAKNLIQNNFSGKCSVW